MGRPRNTGQFGKPTYNQASKIIKRFGGEAALARILNISRISCYRWQYRRPYGCDGLIPSAQVERIRELARANGVLLRPEDWVPETVQYDGLTPIAGQLNRRMSVSLEE